MPRETNHSGMAIAGAVIALAAYSKPAFAYLDPGTGSILIQAAIAAVAAGAFTLRMYWDRLWSYFSGSKPDRKQMQDGSEDAASQDSEQAP